MLALGAHGAVLGTRLAATEESMSSQDRKVLQTRPRRPHLPFFTAPARGFPVETPLRIPCRAQV